MINTIIKAISSSLYQTFGDGYEMYMEEVEQDLKEPCFFIQCLNPTMELFLGKRYFRQNQFCVQFFPATQKKQRECHETAEKMMWCLEYLSVGNDLFHGTKMRYEIVDEILHFFVNYNCFVYRIEEKETMETMESGTGVKGGEIIGS